MEADRIDTSPALELREVRICFSSVDGPPVLAVDGLSFSVAPQEFLALVGPSGCGKTSTLNAMAGLIPIDQGELLLHSVPVSGVNPKVGYISQADHLLPWNTVLDNVALGLQLRHMPRKERQEKARDLIASMGLSGFENSYPHELSGGMKKRVSIAQVLATQPEVLFMDEPFAPLDAFTREKLQEDLLDIWARTHQTIVYVTHDLSESICLADRVLLISGRPGRVHGVYPVPLPRPRRMGDAKLEDACIALERRIRADLRALQQDEGGASDGKT